MTKSNSLRSLKKRRRSADKRGSVKKQSRKFDRKVFSEHHNTPPKEEAAERSGVDKHDERSNEWFPWRNSSVLTDVYSWCRSTVTEGIEVVKDTVLPTRSLRRELNEVTQKLQSMEEKVQRMTQQLQNTHSSPSVDNASSVQIAGPPIAPPPPPIAPPPPAISFKGRAATRQGVKPINREKQQQKQVIVTLSDIQNVQLKTVTANGPNAKQHSTESPEGLLRAGLKRCHHIQRENQFHCSP